MLRLRNLVGQEKKDFAKKLRKNPTIAESMLWKYLRKKQLSVKFTRQSILRGYIVDFYAPSVKLVVEVDGAQHIFNKEYDGHRDGVLLSIGILVLRFANYKIMGDTKNVVSEIQNIVWQRRQEGIKPFTSK